MAKKAKQLELPLKQPNSNGQIDGMFNVSQSKVKTWRACHYRYHLKYVEKLKKRIVKRPLAFGTIIHKVLENWAEGVELEDTLAAIEEANSKVFAAEREEYGEIIDAVRIIMTEYFNYWDERELRFLRFGGRSAEHKFNIEIIPGVNWNGKIDFIGQSRNKAKWAGEHKTFSRRVGPDERWRNLQTSSYIRAIDILGWPTVEGVCWDYIWSKEPIRPQVLQNGTLSNKKIDTLPLAFKEAIAAIGHRERDYKEHLGKAKEGYAQWFERVYTPVNDDVVNALFDDFVLSIREMMDGEGKKKDKNIDRHCGWCDYEPICRAELQGLDVDYVKQREYTKEKDHGLEIPDAD